jgi:hypothetical protein
MRYEEKCEPNGAHKSEKNSPALLASAEHGPSIALGDWT